jgi:hypothetical protein
MNDGTAPPKNNTGMAEQSLQDVQASRFTQAHLSQTFSMPVLLHDAHAGAITQACYYSDSRTSE